MSMSITHSTAPIKGITEAASDCDGAREFRNILVDLDSAARSHPHWKWLPRSSADVVRGSASWIPDGRCPAAKWRRHSRFFCARSSSLDTIW